MFKKLRANTPKVMHCNIIENKNKNLFIKDMSSAHGERITTLYSSPNTIVKSNIYQVSYVSVLD